MASASRSSPSWSNPCSPTGPLAGVNLVCFNPEKDPGGACGDALAELTLAGLGPRD